MQHQDYNQSFEIQQQFQRERVDDLSNLNTNTFESDYLTLNSNDVHMSLSSKSKKLKDKASKKLRQKPINSNLYWYLNEFENIGFDSYDRLNCRKGLLARLGISKRPFERWEMWNYDSLVRYEKRHI